jgi:AmmeMemoRadiSam system protein B/AmmeMemoRadiSam system protein A
MWFLVYGACLGQPGKGRQPAAAGGFYPSDPAELSKMIDGLLARAAAPELEGSVMGLVSPHAGYIYSGAVAAHAYCLLKGRNVERVVVISPSHVEAFSGVSVYDGEQYLTPLGPVSVDTEFALKLAGMKSSIRRSSRGHETRSALGRGEHALEVQLPFLQRALGRFKLVPIVMGEQSYDTCRALGVSLAQLVQGPDTVIVASSDLSHFHPYDEAVKLDRKVVNAIEDWDYLSLSRNFESRVWEACGGGPIVALMMAMERLGAKQAKVLKYANSGDVVMGDRKSVVGYVAVAFAKSAHANPAAEYRLGEPERKQLLAIARSSVETAVREGGMYACNDGGLEALSRDRGAFVTLKKQGRLRGCIGYAAPIKPLCETVRDVAAHAALHDTRFEQVSPAEVKELSYEISVLSPLRRIADVNEVSVGKHGLLIKQGDREGLLLPQVAGEQGWDRLAFLEQTCFKAGLPRNAWKDETSDVFVFSAVVFGEE